VIHNLDTPFGVDHSVRGSLEIHLAQTTADWKIAHQMLNNSVWQEDRHRFRRINIAQNLALTC
jgi:hypothetical protein